MEQMNKKKTVAFVTLGCKVNQYETNAMIQQFQVKLINTKVYMKIRKKREKKFITLFLVKF